MSDSERRAKALLYMNDPGLWPHWPVLPMKRPSRYSTAQKSDDPNTWSFGMLVAWEGNRTTLFCGFIHAIPGGKFGDVFGTLPQKDYTDFEAILDDDWMVD